MTRPLAAVLYDLDGVLIDSRDAWFRVVLAARAHFGYPPIERGTFDATFGQGADQDVRQFYPRQTPGQILEFYGRAFLRELPSVRCLDGSLEVLERIRDRGIPQAVVTNTHRDLAVAVLDATGIASRTQALAAAGDAPEKPAPDLVRLALERLGVGGDEVLYVGDSPTDRLAASRAGVRMVGLGIDGDFRIERLADLLDLVNHRIGH